MSHLHIPETIHAKDHRLLRLAVYSTVITTACVVLCRLLAFVTTKSLAMEGALFDALQDCVMSSLNAFLVLRSIRPADELYPFGYGKVEAGAAVLQSIFLAVISVFLLWESAHRVFIHPQPVHYDRTALSILTVSLALTSALACVQTVVARRTNSLAILADAAHYKSDVALNLGIILCLILSFQAMWFDVAISVGIALYLFLTAVRVGGPAIGILLDRSLPAAAVHTISGIIRNNGAEVHSIQTRSLGRAEHITLHLYYRSDMSVQAVVQKQAALRAALHEHFPRAEIVMTVQISTQAN